MSITVQTDFRVLDDLIEKCQGKPVRIVHDGVEYGVYQEFGTSKMAAHPFMTPAVEALRTEFEEGWKQIDNLEQSDTFMEKIARDVEAEAKSWAPVDTGALRNSIAVHKPEQMGEIVILGF